MPIGMPNLHQVVMRKAVQNQSLDVIIVDTISDPPEVEAAKIIAQRLVQPIATGHGKTLPESMLRHIHSVGMRSVTRGSVIEPVIKSPSSSTKDRLLVGSGIPT
jgi:stage III sporulation protein SpoIIIAA